MLRDGLSAYLVKKNDQCNNFHSLGLSFSALYHFHTHLCDLPTMPPNSNMEKPNTWGQSYYEQI
jgi:hypothetical protein